MPFLVTQCVAVSKSSLLYVLISHIPQQVVSIDMSQLRVVVKVKVHPEPEMDTIINNQKLSVHYLT